MPVDPFGIDTAGFVDSAAGIDGVTGAMRRGFALDAWGCTQDGVAADGSAPPGGVTGAVVVGHRPVPVDDGDGTLAAGTATPSGSLIAGLDGGVGVRGFAFESKPDKLGSPTPATRATGPPAASGAGLGLAVVLRFPSGWPAGDADAVGNVARFAIVCEAPPD